MNARSIAACARPGSAASASANSFDERGQQQVGRTNERLRRLHSRRGESEEGTRQDERGHDAGRSDQVGAESMCPPPHLNEKPGAKEQREGEDRENSRRRSATPPRTRLGEIARRHLCVDQRPAGSRGDREHRGRRRWGHGAHAQRDRREGAGQHESIAQGRRAIDRLENLLGNDGGETSGGAIGVDDRLESSEAGTKRAGGHQKRRRAVEWPREIRDESGPRQRSTGRVVDGYARVSRVFSQRGVERVEETRGGGGVAWGRANQVALAGGSVACRPPTAVAPMYEGAGAPVADKDLPLREDIRLLGRMLERPAAGGDGQRGDESREDDPAERR